MSDLYQQILNTKEVREYDYSIKSEIIDFYNYQNAPIPEECKVSEVTNEDIEKKISELEAKYNDGFISEIVSLKDSVSCKCIEGVYKNRNLYIYPGLKLKGAEIIENDILNHQVNDEVETILCDNPIKVVIQKISSPLKNKINDEMVLKEKIDGVKTLEDYRKYCEQNIKEFKKVEASRKLAGHYFHETVKHSTFDIDEEDKQRWLNEKADMEVFARTMNNDPEMLELLKDSEKLEIEKENIKERYNDSFKHYLVYRRIANDAGYVIDQKEATDIIVNSAKLQNMDYEETMKHVNMHYLVEVCYMNKALEILVNQALSNL